MNKCLNCKHARKIYNKDEQDKFVGCSFMTVDMEPTYRYNFTGKYIYEGYMHPRLPYQKVSSDIMFSTSVTLGAIVRVDESCDRYAKDDQSPFRGC